MLGKIFLMYYIMPIEYNVSNFGLKFQVYIGNILEGGKINDKIFLVFFFVVNFFYIFSNVFQILLYIF